MVRGRAACPRISYDDRGPINGDWAEEIGVADHSLGLDLAPFVVVSELLSSVQLALQDAPVAKPAHVGRRHVMELANPGSAAEIEDLPRTSYVGKPGLVVPFAGMKGKAGRIMDH